MGTRTEDEEEVQPGHNDDYEAMTMVVGCEPVAIAEICTAAGDLLQVVQIQLAGQVYIKAFVVELRPMLRTCKTMSWTPSAKAEHEVDLVAILGRLGQAASGQTGGDNQQRGSSVQMLQCVGGSGLQVDEWGVG